MNWRLACRNPQRTLGRLTGPVGRRARQRRRELVAAAAARGVTEPVEPLSAHASTTCARADSACAVLRPTHPDSTRRSSSVSSSGTGFGFGFGDTRPGSPNPYLPARHASRVPSLRSPLSQLKLHWSGNFCCQSAGQLFLPTRSRIR
jgi:hypothetical protein